uniref:Uncharacterized protein n=1 Tax=Knipowitschia caucasica TaxID=637954 RepID=A0AAV2LL82_KNICA
MDPRAARPGSKDTEPGLKGRLGLKHGTVPLRRGVCGSDWSRNSCFSSGSQGGLPRLWCGCGAAVVLLWCGCGAAVVRLWCGCGAQAQSEDPDQAEPGVCDSASPNHRVYQSRVFYESAATL